MEALTYTGDIRLFFKECYKGNRLHGTLYETPYIPDYDR